MLYYLNNIIYKKYYRFITYFFEKAFFYMCKAARRLIQEFKGMKKYYIYY